MKIYNDQHIILHEAAARALEQAEAAGYSAANIRQRPGDRYPTFDLLHDDGSDICTWITTVPGYVEQTIAYGDGRYIDLRYNLPVVSLEQAAALAAVVGLAA